MTFRDGAVSGAASIVASYLAAQDIPHALLPGGVFVLQLRGERKHTIPVTLAIRDRSLAIESFFMRNPLERHADVYRMLLARNLRARWVHFALGEHGDVYLVGQWPPAIVDEDALDAALGELLTTADEMFDAAIGAGFATYLANDMAWRARQAPGGA